MDIDPGYTAPSTWASGQPAVAALKALFTVHRMLVDSMDRELRRVSKLSTAQIEVLIVLGDTADGRLLMADLARAVNVSRSGITQIVDRLAAEGLVERASGENDRRTVWAVITEAGRATEVSTRPVFLAEARHHLTERLTREEIRALEGMLRRIGQTAVRGC